MATYNFDSFNNGDTAANFTANDYLIFGSGSTASSVRIVPVSSSGLAQASLQVTYGMKTVTFPTSLADASTSTTGGNHIVFSDNTTLRIGSDSATTGDTLTSGSVASSSSTTPTPGNALFGLGGADTITLGTGNDYAYGGVGADTINGTSGSYHIYGNAAGVTSGSVDGADTITVTTGSSFIQGNAGNDIITVGTTASTGYNRIFGGGDSDRINVAGAQGSIAAVNGNKGMDTIVDSSAGANTLRGGADSDVIYQNGSSRAVIMGDAGSDILHVSGSTGTTVGANGFGHVAVLSGGTEADVFDFSAAGAGAAARILSTGTASAAATGGTLYYQEITDFNLGEGDTVNLGAAVGPNGVGHSSTTFATVADAQLYAQGTFAATGTDQHNVVALSVGTSSSAQTYVFYQDAGMNATSTTGIIHMDGVAAGSITGTAFTNTAITAPTGVTGIGV